MEIIRLGKAWLGKARRGEATLARRVLESQGPPSSGRAIKSGETLMLSPHNLYLNLY